MALIVQGSLSHNGNQYAAGDTLDGRTVNAEQRAYLVATGVVVEEVAPEPVKAPAKPKPAAKPAKG